MFPPFDLLLLIKFWSFILLFHHAEGLVMKKGNYWIWIELPHLSLEKKTEKFGVTIVWPKQIFGSQIFKVQTFVFLSLGFNYIFPSASFVFVFAGLPSIKEDKKECLVCYAALSDTCFFYKHSFYKHHQARICRKKSII